VEKTGYKPVLLEVLLSEFKKMNRSQRGKNGAKTTMRKK
jgi:hypothetical protein